MQHDRPKKPWHCRDQRMLIHHWLGRLVWSPPENEGLNHYFQDCAKKAGRRYDCIGMVAGSGHLTAHNEIKRTVYKSMD